MIGDGVGGVSSDEDRNGYTWPSVGLCDGCNSQSRSKVDAVYPWELLQAE